jgi:hypothetical protein
VSQEKQKPLTDKQLSIIPLLAQGMSYQEVTQSTGIPKPTVARWAKLPQVQAEVSRAQQERVKICRQTVTSDIALFKSRLNESLRRQMEYAETAQELGFNCSRLAQTLIKKAPSILEQEGILTPRILATLIPGLIRAADESFKLGSEIEDKVFALEEVSRRLDAWESQWGEHQQ